MCVCERQISRMSELAMGARATAFVPLLKCVSMEKDELSSHSSASMWFEWASVLKHTTYQFADVDGDDDDDDEMRMCRLLKQPFFCRSHSQWLWS